MSLRSMRASESLTKETTRLLNKKTTLSELTWKIPWKLRQRCKSSCNKSMIMYSKWKKRCTNQRKLTLNWWSSSKMPRLRLPVSRKKSPACNSVSTSPSEVIQSIARWQSTWTIIPIEQNSESCSSVKLDAQASTILEQRKSRLLNTENYSKLELEAATLTSMSSSISTHRSKSTNSIEAAQLGDWQVLLHQPKRHLKDRSSKILPITVQTKDHSNFD